MVYNDFLVYNDNLKNATVGNWKNNTIIKNKDRFMRWYNQSLIIFSSEINKSTKQIIEEEELQKNDKIIWIKDLPKNILNEYKKQIQENK